jgi:inosose dehydratase
MANLSQLRLGTAPDPWGVWLPPDPHQVGWQQCLDNFGREARLLTALGAKHFVHLPEQGA